MDIENNNLGELERESSPSHIGRFEIDHIYNENCYKAIKDIPDKSIDCIYTDIPYLFTHSGGGNSALARRIKAEKTLARLKANLDILRQELLS